MAEAADAIAGGTGVARLNAPAHRQTVAVGNFRFEAEGRAGDELRCVDGRLDDCDGSARGTAAATATTAATTPASAAPVSAATPAIEEH